MDVAFVPRPDYLRRGAVPKLNDAGRAVTKTAGGHRLVSNHPNLAKNIRTRRELIARSFATRGLDERYDGPGYLPIIVRAIRLAVSYAGQKPIVFSALP